MTSFGQTGFGTGCGHRFIYNNFMGTIFGHLRYFIAGRQADNHEEK
jgi:hypothetical protein